MKDRSVHRAQIIRSDRSNIYIKNNIPTRMLYPRVLVQEINYKVFFRSSPNMAEIVLKDGNTIEGKVESSDASNVIVELASSEQTIQRFDISAVEHPGEGVAVAGTALTVVGAVLAVIGVPILAIALSSDDSSFLGGGSSFVVGAVLAANGGVLLVPGVPMMIWGWTVNSGSKQRFASPDGFSAEAESYLRFVGIAPLLDSDRDVKGLTLGFQF